MATIVKPKVKKFIVSAKAFGPVISPAYREIMRKHKESQERLIKRSVPKIK